MEQKYYHIFYWLHWDEGFNKEIYIPCNDITDKHPLIWEKEKNEVEVGEKRNHQEMDVTLESWQEISKEIYDSIRLK